jgi:threonine dehydrogenase-like Zn-dependent dehydrogenase
VRRGLAWAAGLAGVVAAFLLRRRGSASVPATDPADELRRKLAEARETEPVAVEPEPEPVPPADADARRREVHEQARAAIEEMHRPDEG